MSNAFVTYTDLFAYTVVLLTVSALTGAAVFKACKWFFDELHKHDKDEKKK